MKKNIWYTLVIIFNQILIQKHDYHLYVNFCTKATNYIHCDNFFHLIFHIVTRSNCPSIASISLLFFYSFSFSFSFSFSSCHVFSSSFQFFSFVFRLLLQSPFNFLIFPPPVTLLSFLFLFLLRIFFFFFSRPCSLSPDLIIYLFSGISFRLFT